MSDDEALSNNPMDVDISASDDEEIKESTLSKSSTPDSSSLPASVTRKPPTTKKATLTKSNATPSLGLNRRASFLAKSALVNYERDSDDDEHSDDEVDEDEQEEENDSNSQGEFVLHATGEIDPNDSNALNEQITLTSDLLTGTSVGLLHSSPISLVSRSKPTKLLRRLAVISPQVRFALSLKLFIPSRRSSFRSSADLS